MVGCFGVGDGAQDGVLLGGAIGGGHFCGMLEECLFCFMVVVKKRMWTVVCIVDGKVDMQ